MAWKCSGVCNESMIRQLERASLLLTPAVIDAFHRVDRGLFVPSSLVQLAYNDEPLPIGHNATISAPHMHAMMAEIVAPVILRALRTSPPVVLDVGSGSGYLTAVLCAMCGQGSTVVGVEHVPELVKRSMAVVKEHFGSWVDEGRIRFIQADGRNIAELFDDMPREFDVIHVGAAADVVPRSYLNALRPGGCLVVPVGGEDSTQVLRVYTKDEKGCVSQQDRESVRFVPLTSLDHQLRRP
uniref:protein-L-isoaspartate(D-aspartate) O-methyltransferase n=1 Tax=Trypanosoma vivax (strain Y486) TaxID=1055687 RepID=G0U766_TRYVY|nr:putative protein-L-isoaspartate [Trypanosoma vivax Y486]